MFTMASTLLTANSLAQIRVVFEVCLASWHVIKHKNKLHLQTIRENQKADMLI